MHVILAKKSNVGIIINKNDIIAYKIKKCNSKYIIYIYKFYSDWHFLKPLIEPI
jgi:hypothetical protein